VGWLRENSKRARTGEVEMGREGERGMSSGLWGIVDRALCLCWLRRRLRRLAWEWTAKRPCWCRVEGDDGTITSGEGLPGRVGVKAKCEQRHSPWGQTQQQQIKSKRNATREGWKAHRTSET
jgi:hypothetical protein